MMGTKLFQITEDDLAELERTLPRWLDRMYPQMDNQLRTQTRRVQEVLQNVRWNYGPPGEVIVIPAGGEPPNDPLADSPPPR